MKRRIIAYTLILFVLVFLIFLYHMKYSRRAIHARENEKNIEIVKIGISKYEMLQIMGSPDDISNHPVDPKVKIYYYEPSFGSSDGIYIYLENDLQVTKIKKDN